MVGGILTAVPALAQSVGMPSVVCHLTTTVHYSPTLSSTSQTRAFRTEEILDGCSQDLDGYPYTLADKSTGTRSSGNVWTDPKTGYKWQEPIGTATGNCTSNTLSGIYIIRWAGGEIAIVEETTTSQTWGVRTEGHGRRNVTLTAVDRKPGQPATLTLVGLYENHATSAVLLSHPNPTDPLECTSSGVSTATRSGTYEIYARVGPQ
jgi:hypothetical protein